MILGGPLNFDEALPTFCCSSCDCLGSLMSTDDAESSKPRRKD